MLTRSLALQLLNPAFTPLQETLQGVLQQALQPRRQPPPTPGRGPQVCQGQCWSQETCVRALGKRMGTRASPDSRARARFGSLDGHAAGRTKEVLRAVGP